ncbi:TRAP transporter large permease subunit [Alkalihalobacillus sp. AL-G]|uniref:TRAP transporter large permease n=1 Tax=Alkalihalobacillus sp. AL-G TaxID=2926399 RepID=UPI00272B1097|nr:TRAP transporter large permease subunit [Alkalihalobacillus sp. AL-G]WLD93824.1 TRAP transporter large permease subunit [Alkalihalobacillus sp. AL-G]
MSIILMNPYVITALMVLCMVFFLVMGYPVAFVLGGLATIFGLIFIGPSVISFSMFEIYGTFSEYLLVAVPLFVFMGVIIEKSGLAARLYDAMHVILGRLPGGLAVTTVITSTIFAAATGVVNASVVTMGVLALPAMLKHKYNIPLATGSITAGGTLGVLIPPSVIILIYGPVAGISVGKLFMAAIFPGILLSLLYVIYVIIHCSIKPEHGPPLPKSEVNIPLSKKLYLLATSVLPVGLLMLAVLGTIFFGIASPTEAAGIGALAALLLAAAYKKLSFKNLKESVYRATTVSAMTFMILIGAGIFTIVFIRLGGNQVVENMLLSLPFPAWGILLAMLVIIFLMGMFLDEIAIIMIAIPIISPIADGLGYDPLWFALLVMVTMQTGFLSPPFALSIFYLKGVAPPEVTTSHIYKGVIPFIGLQILAIILLILFPELITWLPNLMIE